MYLVAQFQSPQLAGLRLLDLAHLRHECLPEKRMALGKTYQLTNLS